MCYRQTITNVITFLKEGHSAYGYYEHYKANKKRCGRKETQLNHEMQDFIQDHLEQDLVNGVYPDKSPCSMRTLYRLAERGVFRKEDLLWKGKRKPN